MDPELVAIITTLCLVVGGFIFTGSVLTRVKGVKTGDKRKVRQANLLEALAMLFLSVVVLVPTFYVVVLGRFWVAQIPFELAVGWAQYLLRVLSRVDADPWAVVSAVACLAAVIVGSHFTLRWLMATADRRWPLKRTLQFVALVVLLFVSGL